MQRKKANAATTGDNGVSEIEADEFFVPEISDHLTLLPLFATKESVSLYISRAAEKLRGQQSFARTVHVSIRTSPLNEKEPYYANSMTITLPRQTNDTRLLTRVALWELRRIYRTGYKYQKAGVMLSELISRQYRQIDLFGSIDTDTDTDTRASQLMRVMDQIDARMGRGALKLASEGFKQPLEDEAGE